MGEPELGMLKSTGATLLLLVVILSIRAVLKRRGYWPQPRKLSQLSRREKILLAALVVVFFVTFLVLAFHNKP